ncbi:MAG TPA: sugar ABC transporter substrate-binding protein [Desulfovibrio sp.]|nr:sugar ABC transporter substrate-binding protein [Desulfovibrio sp.]
MVCSPCASYAQKTIVAIPKATILNFWRIVCLGAHQAVDTPDIKLIWRGSRVENKPEAQQHLLEYYIAHNVDAIVLAPTNLKELNPYIEKATKAGIKVVLMGSPATTDSYDSYIATDNYKAGEIAAELLFKRLTKPGPVLIIGNSLNNGSCALRTQGFIDKMQKISPGRSIISIHMRDGSEREARMATEELMINNPDLTGIFAVSESTTDGALHTLTNHDESRIPFIGFDYNRKLIEAVRDGKIDALITQRPYAMGFFGVRAAMDLLNGKEVPRNMESPVTVLTHENFENAMSLRCLSRITDIEKADCPICFN